MKTLRTFWPQILCVMVGMVLQWFLIVTIRSQSLPAELPLTTNGFRVHLPADELTRCFVVLSMDTSGAEQFSNYVWLKIDMATTNMRCFNRAGLQLFESMPEINDTFLNPPLLP